jgi:hypothetical protein
LWFGGAENFCGFGPGYEKFLLAGHDRLGFEAMMPVSRISVYSTNIPPPTVTRGQRTKRRYYPLAYKMN